MSRQTEFGFVEALAPVSPVASFPFSAQDALSVLSRRKGQKWLRVEVARALRKNARSQMQAGHDERTKG